jgi:hypothetical protein
MIACSLAIFSAAEMKKPKTRRECKARLLEVPSTMEWADFQAQLNVQISDTLYPTATVIDYSKFETTYTIPRHVPNALPLLALADYTYLVKNAMKLRDPAIKIIIVETGMQLAVGTQAVNFTLYIIVEKTDTLISQVSEAEKENDADTEPPKKKAQKSKVCICCC